MKQAVAEQLSGTAQDTPCQKPHSNQLHRPWNSPAKDWLLASQFFALGMPGIKISLPFVRLTLFLPPRLNQLRFLQTP